MTQSRILTWMIAVWASMVGSLLLVDAYTLIPIFDVASPFDKAPTWISLSIALTYLFGSATLIFALLWSGQNIRPALTAGKIAWTALATAGAITVVVCLTYHSHAIITTAISTCLAVASICEVYVLVIKEKRAYRRKDRRQALQALGTDMLERHCLP